MDGKILISTIHYGKTSVETFADADFFQRMCSVGIINEIGSVTMYQRTTTPPEPKVEFVKMRFKKTRTQKTRLKKLSKVPHYIQDIWRSQLSQRREELPLINVMQVERLLDEYILNPVRKVLSTDLRLSDKDLDNIMFGYKLGNQKNNIKEAINWIDTLMGKDFSSIPDVHLQTFKTFLLSLSGEETEWGVVVEGKEVFVHSKKWDKSIGETHPTIDNGFVTIKSIYKL